MKSSYSSDHMNGVSHSFSAADKVGFEKLSQSSPFHSSLQSITTLMAQSDKDIYKPSDLSNIWPPAQEFWWNEAIFVDMREYERNRRRCCIERLCSGCLETLLTVKQAACTHTLIN